MSPSGTPRISREANAPVQLLLSPSAFTDDPIHTSSTTTSLNIPYGDPIELKDPGLYRHLGGNVNGISPQNRFHEASILAMQAEAYQADGISYIETNVDFQFRGALHQIRSRLRPAWVNVLNMISSNSAKSFHSYYQPGGVCQAVGGAWSRRITISTSDPSELGQWTYQTISGKPGRHLSIITAYQTCPGGSTSGEKTTWKQRQAILTSQASHLDHMTPDPRKQFAHDLLELCRSLTLLGHGILLFIDANSHLDDAKSWLHSFLNHSKLTDIYEHRHGFDHAPATYQRGSHRIDFMFASSDVLPHIHTCGYTSFVSTSDHRQMFCDLHLTSYLQDAPPLSIDLSNRHIVSKYRKMSTQYKENVLRQLHSSNYLDIMPKIQASIESNAHLTDTSRRLLEHLDNLITTAMVNTEKSMRRYYNHAWSPTLVHAAQQLQYWKAWMKEKLTGRDLSASREKFLRMTQDPTQYPLTSPDIPEIRKNIRLSAQNIRRITADSKHIREQWLLDQEDIAHDKGDIERARRLRNIRRAEESATSFSKIRIAIHGTTEGALKTLLVPNPNSSDYIRITDPIEIVDKLIERNLKHFNQSHGTTFTQRHLEQICSLTFTEALPRLTQLTGTGNEAYDAIVEQLSIPLSLPDAHASLLSTSDFTQKLRTWKEKTSTSPSHRHLGLYRALLKGKNPTLTPLSHPRNPYKRITIADSNLDPEPDHGELLFQTMTQIINTCVQHGHVLQRWKKINNVMLEKIPGRPLLDKLRVIHIFEADFNAWAGIVFGRRMMQKAELLNTLGDEQGGSRKGRSSIDVYAMKFFSFQISAISRTPLAVMDNDAKACYDRIVMAAAYLRCQQIGIPHNACKLMDLFLSHAEYHIQTQLGTAEKFYTSTTDNKLHGPGQGSQCSPAIWTALSTMLLHAVRSKSPGTKFCNPSQTLSVSHYMQSFVDDSSIWVNDFLTSFTQQNNIQSIVDQLQRATQWWEQLLVTTGGKLELSKCFFYLIEWDFSHLHPRPKVPDTPYQISITQTTDNSVEQIEHKPSNVSHRTLGFQAKPNNDFSEQFQTLLQSSRNITRAIRSTHMDAVSAHRTYHAVFLPRMRYPLHLCGLSPGKLHQIQSGPLNTTLQALGYPCSFPRALVFGNSSTGGLGFTPLAVEQGILNTTFLLKHLRQRSQIGDIIRITLSWLQQFSGADFPLLQYPSRETVHFPDKWITEFRRFLTSVNGSIFLPDYQTFPKHRHGDCYIMSEAHRHHFTPADLSHINNVRLHLQVTRISDISTATGKHLLFSANEQPGPHQFPSTSIELWPNQPKPPPSSWTKWRQFMERITKDGTTLRNPLGPWIPQSFNRRWNTMYDTATDHVLHRNQTQWDVYPVHHTILHGIVTLPTAVDSDKHPSPTCIPIEPHRNPQRYSEPKYVSLPASCQSHPTTLALYIARLQQWEADLLQYNQSLPLAAPLWQSLLQGQPIHLVSDGGHKGVDGSFGWVIANEHQVLWEGWGLAHGYPMSSYRAEAYGRLAALRFLLQYITFLGIQSPPTLTIQSATDNQELLRNETRWRNNLIPNANYQLQPDADLLAVLNESWTTLNLPATHAHVKGHQDLNTPIHKLPWVAQLNIHADRLATHALETLSQCRPRRPIIPPSPATLLLDHKHVTSKFERTIRLEAGKTSVRNYLATKQIANATYDAIHWEAFHTARARLPVRRQAFVTKTLCDWVPTNSHKAKIDPNATPHCPHCSCHSETFDHVLQCTINSTWREEFLNAMKAWHTQHHTPPNIIQQIARATSAHLFLHPDKADQHLIPPRLLCRGCIPTEWIPLVTSHFRAINCLTYQSTGNTWARQLSTFFLDQIYLAWTHRSSVADTNQLNAAARQTRHQYELEITRLYNLQSQTTLKYPFSMPLQLRLRLPTDQHFAWLRNQRENILNSHSRWKKRHPLRQRSLLSYFTRTRPKPS